MSDLSKLLGGALVVVYAAFLLWVFVPSEIPFHGWVGISWALVIIIRTAVPSKNDEQ